MEPTVLILILALVVVAACVYMNNKQHATYGKIVSDAQDVAHKALEAIEHIGAQPALPAPQPANVSHNVTLSLPPAPQPAGLLPPPKAPQVDGIDVPSDTDYTTFGLLVLATEAVKTALSTAGLDWSSDSVDSQAWWNRLGRFMREQYIAQSDGWLLDRFKKFAADPTSPKLEPISVMDQTCANAAMKAAADSVKTA